MKASVNLGGLRQPADIMRLQQYLEELYELHDAVYTTTAPNGSLVAHRGKTAIYYNGSTHEMWQNIDGTSTWQRVDVQPLWEVDGTEHQLKTADEIDMQSKKIINLLDPTDDQDAATKKFIGDNYQAIGAAAGGDLSGTYPNPTIGSSKVDNDNMADAAIHQAELYSTQASQAATPGGSNVLAEITMHDYSFFPNIYVSGADQTNILCPVNDDTNSTIGRFTIFLPSGGAYDVQWRYVAASDPEHWIFVALNKITLQMTVWEAPDHPHMQDDSFPNPFTQFDNNPDYEISLLDIANIAELKSKVTRDKCLSRVILDEYELDKEVKFKEKIAIEIDEWDDKNWEIIKTYKGKGPSGKTKKLKKKIFTELPPNIKYRKLRRR